MVDDEEGLRSESRGETPTGRSCLNVKDILDGRKRAGRSESSSSSSAIEDCDANCSTSRSRQGGRHSLGLGKPRRRSGDGLCSALKFRRGRTPNSHDAASGSTSMRGKSAGEGRRHSACHTGGGSGLLGTTARRRCRSTDSIPSLASRDVAIMPSGQRTPMRSICKWVLHRVTGRCELERLAQSYQPHKVEHCIANSRQLCPTGVPWAVLHEVLPARDSVDDMSLQRHPSPSSSCRRRRGDDGSDLATPKSSEVSRATTAEGSVSLGGVVGIVVDCKPICDVEGFRVGMERNLQAIQNVTRAMVVVEGFAKDPYDRSNIQHERMLSKLWELLRPSSRLTGRISRDWVDLGFQGDDPATDFRGCGVLGLYNLLFLADRYTTEARVMLRQSHHPLMWYSFAITGINISSWLHQWLLDRGLRRVPGLPKSTLGTTASSISPQCIGNATVTTPQLERRKSSSSALASSTLRPSSCLAAPTAFQCAPPPNLHQFFYHVSSEQEVLRTFNHLYVFTFLSFHRFWFDKRPANVMEFPRIAAEFRRSFRLPDGLPAEQLVEKGGVRLDAWRTDRRAQ